jgi:hypothetical protein
MTAFVASPEFGTIIQPIPAPRILPEVARQMVTDGYRNKDELHVTIVNSEFGRTLSGKAFGTLAEYFDACPPLDLDVLGTLYEVEKSKLVDGLVHPRRTLVALVASRKLLRTMQVARYETGLALPSPFLHVTVATKPDTPIARRGIGIASEQEWISLGALPYATEWSA